MVKKELTPGIPAGQTSIRGGLPRAVVVLSMVGKNYRLTADMIDAAAALNLPLASQAMTLRQIYADAPGQGKVVWNMGSRAREAASEVTQIFSEILPFAAVTPISLSMAGTFRENA
jgi:chromosome partitioning protein